jgi:predicted esterase
MAPIKTDGFLALTFDVPYTLLQPDVDSREPRPMVIALHGMGQTPAHMQQMLAPLLDQPWLFLFPRGLWPYEIRKADKHAIGYAWYVFDGDQGRLRASMDLAGAHLCGLHDELRARFNVGRTALVGFSQGGYVAGYIGPRHADRFAAAASIAGRIKHEFHAQASSVALAQFHGARDIAVKAEAAREAAEKSRALGFDVTYFEDPQAAHEISPAMCEALGEWLRRVL